MSIIDAIKSSVLSQFDASLALEDVMFSLLVSLIISVLIILVYRMTFSGIVYSRGTTLTILLLTLATAMIIRTINSNLSLSLGMVGALSIVRFRTAIKDPVDTAFLFWGVTAGIMSGAGLYLIAILGSLGIAVIYYVAFLVSVKSKKQYLLILSYTEENREKVETAIGKLGKKQLKSRSYSENGIEATYQVNCSEELDKLINSLRSESLVKRVDLVAYNSDFGL